MQKNEHLKPAEFLSSKPAKQASVETELTLASAERVFEARTEMLHSIQESLSRPLREALVIKLDHEKRALLEMLESDVQEQEAQKKRNKILDYTYFKKKPLNFKNL